MLLNCSFQKKKSINYLIFVNPEAPEVVNFAFFTRFRLENRIDGLFLNVRPDKKNCGFI